METFNGLDMQSKTLLLGVYGHVIERISYFQYHVTLYSFDRFFIEEFFDTETKSITRISIAEERDLKKYLMHIDISTLTGPADNH
jgi:hypothetical protein